MFTIYNLIKTIHVFRISSKIHDTTIQLDPSLKTISYFTVLISRFRIGTEAPVSLLSPLGSLKKSIPPFPPNPGSPPKPIENA
jgi:hypothetical protein